MRSCFILAWLGGAALAVLQAANSVEPMHKMTTVVRADPRSGKLVRTLAVTGRVVRAQDVKPREIRPLEPAATTGGERPASLEAFIEETARRYAIDPLLVHAIIKIESNYNPVAVSPKGAMRMMQLMPGTARRFDVGDTFNPAENIEGGVRYLKYLLTMFDGDERLALAAYNAGEGAVFRYGNIPPYSETTDYVYKVGKKWGEARREQERRQAQPPQAPRIEQFVDAAGNLHIRTQPSP